MVRSPHVFVYLPGCCWVHPIVHGEVGLGRAGRMSVRLPSGSIARRHARIYERDGRFFVHDERSTNGTILNGSRIDGDQPLAAGDQLDMGAAHLVFDDGPPLAWLCSPSAPHRQVPLGRRLQWYRSDFTEPLSWPSLGDHFAEHGAHRHVAPDGTVTSLVEGASVDTDIGRWTYRRDLRLHAVGANVSEPDRRRLHSVFRLLDSPEAERRRQGLELVRQLDPDVLLACTGEPRYEQRRLHFANTPKGDRTLEAIGRCALSRSSRHAALRATVDVLRIDLLEPVPWSRLERQAGPTAPAQLDTAPLHAFPNLTHLVFDGIARVAGPPLPQVRRISLDDVAGIPLFALTPMQGAAGERRAAFPNAEVQTVPES